MATRTCGGAAVIRRARAAVVVVLSAALAVLVFAPTAAVLREVGAQGVLDTLTAPPVPAVLARTIGTALVAMVIALPLALGLAFAIRNSGGWIRLVGFLACAMPAAMNALVIILAWLVILQRNGVVGTGLRSLGWVDTSLQLLYRPGSSTVALVYAIFPVMALVILWGLVRIDPQVRESAILLGARRSHLFWLETGSLVRPMMLAVTVGFISVLNLYLVPEFLSGPSMGQLGYLVQQHVLTSYDLGGAATLALVLMALAGAPMALMLLVERQLP